MAEDKKSAYRHALEAAARFKKRVDEAKEQGEMIAGEVMRTGISTGAAFTAGFVDQRFGEVDASTGIRVHKVNGAPSALLAGGSCKIAAGFGLFGKFQVVGFAAGDGAISHSGGTWGRMAGERYRRLQASKETQAPPKQVTEGSKQTASAAVATATAQAEPVAVAAAQ